MRNVDGGIDKKKLPPIHAHKKFIDMRRAKNFYTKRSLFQAFKQMREPKGVTFVALSSTLSREFNFICQRILCFE